MGINITYTINSKNNLIIKYIQLGFIVLFKYIDILDYKHSLQYFESMDYVSVIGILIYLAVNVYPEIQYSVYQYIYFSYVSHHSYVIIIKYIAHYLCGVFINKNSLCFPKYTDLNLDLFIDNDYTGF